MKLHWEIQGEGVDANQIAILGGDVDILSSHTMEIGAF